MDNTKDWNLLSENEKQYWILIYKGHSKLNSHDPIPEKYQSKIKGILNLADHLALEKDKKDFPWKYIKTYLGKRGKVK